MIGIHVLTNLLYDSRNLNFESFHLRVILSHFESHCESHLICDDDSSQFLSFFFTAASEVDFLFLFFLGLENEVTVVVFVAAGRRLRDLGVGQLPGDQPVAFLASNVDNSTVGDLMKRRIIRLGYVN